MSYMKQLRREQMVNEVESILNEIRERVRTDHERGAGKDSLAHSNAERASEYAPHQALSPSPNGSVESVGTNESLSRLSAHLTTTARAWDRLPPMYSNRQGGRPDSNSGSRLGSSP